MLKEVFIERDQSAWWLTALDYIDWSLDTVATPDRIDDVNAAQDSGAARYAELYQAIGAVYFEEDGTPVRIESVPEAYSFNSDTSSETFAFRVGDDTVTVHTIPDAESSEAAIAVYKLSDGIEDKEICVSTQFNFHNKTTVEDLKSNATDYVESRTGEYNRLQVSSKKSHETGEFLKLSRRDAAIMYCFLRAAAGDDPKRIVIPLYDDIRLFTKPPTLSRNARRVADFPLN
jgi:hypothetical protein